MILRANIKPLIFKCTLLTFIFFGTTLFSAISADPNTTIGDLNARIDDLERQITNGGERTDDKNPGSQVTSEDLELLKEEIRALKDSRQKAESTNKLQDEMKLLREEIMQLKEQRSKEKSSSIDSKEPIEEDHETSDSTKGKSISKPEEEHDSELKSSAQHPSSVVDDEETDAILKLLSDSATPEEESAQASKSSQDIETIREEATKHVAETAPKLPVGNAEAQYNEAFALHDRGAYKESERAFSYFIKTYPNDPLVSKAMYWKAESCMQQKKYKDAKILFVNAYKKNPKGPKAPNCLLKLGEILAIESKTEDACTAWRKLSADFPHMTSEMKQELETMKKQYKCVKTAGKISKSSSKT